MTKTLTSDTSRRLDQLKSYHFSAHVASLMPRLVFAESVSPSCLLPTRLHDLLGCLRLQLGYQYLSSRPLCRNAIPNCGRNRQPTTEQHARTASWMRTDQATGSNRGTSESSKRMVTLHTRVLPERALIYTQ